MKPLLTTRARPPRGVPRVSANIGASGCPGDAAVWSEAEGAHRVARKNKKEKRFTKIRKRKT